MLAPRCRSTSTTEVCPFREAWRRAVDHHYITSIEIVRYTPPPTSSHTHKEFMINGKQIICPVEHKHWKIDCASHQYSDSLFRVLYWSRSVNRRATVSMSQIFMSTFEDILIDAIENHSSRKQIIKIRASISKSLSMKSHHRWNIPTIERPRPKIKDISSKLMHQNRDDDH